jgi:hypothetical protein
MARAITLGTLVTRCQQRANKVAADDGQIETPEWKALISEFYGVMHALIVEKGARQFEAETVITADGSATYALPSNYLTTIGVDAYLNGASGARRPVHGPIAMQERARLMGRHGAAIRYGFEGTALALYPVPPGGTYVHLYVPQPTDLSTSTDATSVDLINIYGEQFVVWGVASVAMHRGESQQSRAVDEHEKARGQLEYWACMRALTQPSYRVADDECDDYRDPADWRYAR